MKVRVLCLIGVVASVPLMGLGMVRRAHAEEPAAVSRLESTVKTLVHAGDLRLPSIGASADIATSTQMREWSLALGVSRAGEIIAIPKDAAFGLYSQEQLKTLPGDWSEDAKNLTLPETREFLWHAQTVLASRERRRNATHSSTNEFGRKLWELDVLLIADQSAHWDHVIALLGVLAEKNFWRTRIAIEAARSVEDPAPSPPSTQSVRWLDMFIMEVQQHWAGTFEGTSSEGISEFSDAPAAPQVVIRQYEDTRSAASQQGGDDPRERRLGYEFGATAYGNLTDLKSAVSKALGPRKEGEQPRALWLRADGDVMFADLLRTREALVGCGVDTIFLFDEPLFMRVIAESE